MFDYDVIGKALERIEPTEPLCNCRKALERDHDAGCSAACVRATERLAAALLSSPPPNA